MRHLNGELVINALTHYHQYKLILKTYFNIMEMLIIYF